MIQNTNPCATGEDPGNPAGISKHVQSPSRRERTKLGEDHIEDSTNSDACDTESASIQAGSDGETRLSRDRHKHEGCENDWVAEQAVEVVQED